MDAQVHAGFEPLSCPPLGVETAFVTRSTRTPETGGFDAGHQTVNSVNFAPR
jgi:hypothetical protein